MYQFFSSIKDLESSIEAIRIVRDPGTGLGKGIAYVLFKTRVRVVNFGDLCYLSSMNLAILALSVISISWQALKCLRSNFLIGKICLTILTLSVFILVFHSSF